MIPEYPSIRTLQRLLADKVISPRDLREHCRQLCMRYDARLHTTLELFEAFDTNSGGSAGLLAHIPGMIKDNICVKGRTMSCASRVLERYTAVYNATVIEKLYRAGAIVLGRANMDEFAMGSSTEHSAFGSTRNPWNVDYVPGGSSGGSIAAVAAGFVPWALGSETGGSVRQPAAWCGIVGLKPTYGLVSRYGLTAYASSLDQIGVAARSVYDAALVLSVIAGREEPVRDSTALLLPRDYLLTNALDGIMPKGIRIGIIDNAFNVPGVSPEVVRLLEDAIAMLRSLGAHIVPVRLPSMDLGAATYFVISRAEASSNLARFDGVRYGRRSTHADTLFNMYANSRSEGFGEEVQRRILIGTYVLSHGHADAYYRSALNAQMLMKEETRRIFGEVDLLFAPVSPTEAFPLGTFAENSLQLDLQDYFTCFANLVGIPAIAIPCGFTTRSMPIGFQLMGPSMSEQLLCQVGYAYETATPWHTMHPQLLHV